MVEIRQPEQIQLYRLYRDRYVLHGYQWAGLLYVLYVLEQKKKKEKEVGLFKNT